MERTRSLIVVLVAVLSGCSHRVPTMAPRQNAPEISQNDFIDLQPGMRLSVITPILKSGGYRLRAVESAPEEAKTDTRTGPTLSMSAGSEFLGYERSYYTVTARAGGGVRIRFASAETYQDGITTSQARPIAKLFHLPPAGRYVRLVYLRRASAADHDMAVIGASHQRDLDTLTAAVQADAGACGRYRAVFCGWVPAGIAVRPEVEGPGAGWNPAR